MSLATWLRYLIGDQQAILELAGDRRALWVGFLFVLSAGFAREYDGEDLLAEPWHLLIPLGASLLASVVLFLLTWGTAAAQGAKGPPFWSAYASFLTLFWLTAPLAWLYAIPYERFLTPADAVRANLWTLAAVSVWRVALMVRVVMVLMGYRFLAALCRVMVVADGLALVGVCFLPLPLIPIMGGLRLTESERVLATVVGAVLNLGVCTGIFWLLGALFVKSEPAWQAPALVREHDLPPQRGLLFLALAALVVWVFILPFTQPEQQRRHRVERALKEDRIAAALAEMSAHAPEDFPPHWDPPPRSSYRWDRPPLLAVLRAMAENPPASWVRERYLEKLRPFVSTPYGVPDEQLPEVALLLRQLPEGRGFVQKLAQQEDDSGRGKRLLELFEEKQPPTALGSEERMGNRSR